MKLAQNFYDIFYATTQKYHETDDVDAIVANPYEKGTIEHTMFAKNWIDAVQWHLEDIIRDPNIDPVAALALKRRIDRSNQDRTDMVEEIDTYFREKYSDVTPRPDATINTESPAWALDDINGENSDTNGESSRMSVYGTWLISDCAVEHGLGSTYTLT